MTRKFYHGRTETMRPCTSEALNWCKAMVDPACDVRALALFESTVGSGDIPGVIVGSKKVFLFRWEPRGRPCCWPSRNTTS